MWACPVASGTPCSSAQAQIGLRRIDTELCAHQPPVGSVMANELARSRAGVADALVQRRGHRRRDRGDRMDVAFALRLGHVLAGKPGMFGTREVTAMPNRAVAGWRRGAQIVASGGRSVWRESMEHDGSVFTVIVPQRWPR